MYDLPTETSWGLLPPCPSLSLMTNSELHMYSSGKSQDMFKDCETLLIISCLCKCLTIEWDSAKDLDHRCSLLLNYRIEGLHHQGVRAHNRTPGPREAEAEWVQFKTSLPYRTSFRSVRNTPGRNPVSRTNKQNKQKQTLKKEEERKQRSNIKWRISQWREKFLARVGFHPHI